MEYQLVVCKFSSFSKSKYGARGALKLEVGYDFDCVVVEFAEVFCELAQKMYNIPISASDIATYSLAEIHPRMTRSRADRLIAIATDPSHPEFDTSLQMRPTPGSVEALQRHTSVHGRVVIITARPSSGPVEDWLREAGVDGAEVYCASAAHKVARVQECGLSGFVDDNLQTCYQMINMNLSAVVMDRPWNRNVDPNFQGQLRRITSLQQLYAPLEVSCVR